MCPIPDAYAALDPLLYVRLLQVDVVGAFSFDLRLFESLLRELVEASFGVLDCLFAAPVFFGAGFFLLLFCSFFFGVVSISTREKQNCYNLSRRERQNPRRGR